MQKIALYTIQSVNYGNRLQNYASQEVLKSLGYEVVTLRNNPLGSEAELQIALHPYLRIFKHVLPLMRYIKISIYGLLNLDKNNNYRLFNKKIKYTSDYIGVDGFSDDFEKYDAIVAGSDQIWNTDFEFVSINSFFPFEHPSKISFSSSFGVDSIDNGSEVAECLNRFKALSVREESGARIINELTGRNAEVLVDPTMMLSADEWRAVSKKPRGFKEHPYILTYFLSPKCEEASQQLKKLSEDKLQVYELFDESNKVTRCAGPSEFLHLIDHASIILTDSFHACVFSFLFNKPFIVYDRNKGGKTMNSRLNTLLHKFHIERKYTGAELENDVWEHDYSDGYEQLMVERQKAKKFLRESLM